MIEKVLQRLVTIVVLELGFDEEKANLRSNTNGILTMVQHLSTHLVVVLLDFVVGLERLGEDELVHLLGHATENARLTHIDVLPR